MTNIEEKSDNMLYDPFFILVNLYIEDDINAIITMLNRCRINPDFNPDCIQRNDLEFYVPQICNYLVFQ